MNRLGRNSTFMGLLFGHTVLSCFPKIYDRELDGWPMAKTGDLDGRDLPWDRPIDKRSLQE